MSNFCSEQGRIRRRLKKALVGKQGFAVPAKRDRKAYASVRRSRKPAENAEQGKKGHLWMDTN
jgi:hypothetical protein